ncbi:MAG: CatA-like O-acetyltransferase [Anaerovibrio sp.]|nr:CatA-like O-acetyltransferase [Anaerovibrio sp.]
MFLEMQKETWAGYPMYQQFGTMDIPFYSVTVMLEVTELLRVSQVREISFSTLCLYSVAQAVNSVEGFRYRVLEDGRVVLHDLVRLAYVIRMPDGRITGVEAHPYKDFERFCREQREREQEAAANGPQFYRGSDRGVFFFSNVPWLSFTSGSQPVNIGRRYDSIPRLTIGKYVIDAGGRALLPFNMHMHHGFVDGFSAGDLVQAVQNIWSEFCEEHS